MSRKIYLSVKRLLAILLAIVLVSVSIPVSAFDGTDSTDPVSLLGSGTSDNLEDGNLQGPDNPEDGNLPKQNGSGGEGEDKSGQNQESGAPAETVVVVLDGEDVDLENVKVMYTLGEDGQPDEESVPLDNDGMIFLDGADSFRLFVEGLEDGYKAVYSPSPNRLSTYALYRVANLGDNPTIFINIVAVDSGSDGDGEDPAQSASFGVRVFAQLEEDETLDLSMVEVTLSGEGMDEVTEGPDETATEVTDIVFEFDVPGDDVGNVFTLSVAGVPEGYTVSDKTLSRDELTGVIDIELVKETVKVEPFVLRLSIHEVKTGNIFSQAFRAISDWLSGGSTVVVGLNVEVFLLNADGTRGEKVGEGVTDDKGDADIDFGEYIIDETANYLVHISGMLNTYAVYDADGNTKWELDGIGYRKEFEGKELKEEGALKGLQLIKLESGVYTLKAESFYNAIPKSTPVETKFILETYDRSDAERNKPLSVDEQEGTTASWDLLGEQVYIFRIVAPAAGDYMTSNTFQSIKGILSRHRNEFEYLGASEDGDGRVVYSFALDFKSSTYAFENFSVTFTKGNLPVTVNKTYAMDYKSEYPSYIGIADSSKGGYIEQWIELKGSQETVVFNPLPFYNIIEEDYFDQTFPYIGSGTVLYVLYEYVPADCMPQGSGWRQVMTHQGYQPLPNTPDGVVYRLYENGQYISNTTSREIEITNGNVDLDINPNPNKDLYLPGNLEAETVPARDWEITKEVTKIKVKGQDTNQTDKVVLNERGDEYDISYKTTFEKIEGDKSFVYKLFIDKAHVKISYNALAAFGNNRLVGKLSLYKYQEDSGKENARRVGYEDFNVLLSRGSSVNINDPQRTLTLEADFTDDDYRYEENWIYYLKFEGGIYYSATGNPSAEDFSEISMEMDGVIVNKIPNPQQDEDYDRDYDIQIKDFLDKLNEELNGSYTINDIDGVKVDGEDVTSRYRRTDEGFSISNNRWGTLSDLGEPTTIVVEYTVHFIDNSDSPDVAACFGQYIITNRSSGTKSTSNRIKYSNTVETPVIVPTYGFFQAKKTREVNGVTSNEQNVIFELYAASDTYRTTLLATAKTGTDGTGNFLDNGELFKVWGDDKQKEYQVVLTIPDAAYPPDKSWTKLEDTLFVKTVQLTNKVNGNLCGMTPVTAVDKPTNELIVTKEGAGLGDGESTFYLYNSAEALILGSPWSPNATNASKEFKNLEAGTYTLYEVTNKSYKPSGSEWGEVTTGFPTDINKVVNTATQHVYKRTIVVPLVSGTTITVTNYQLQDLEIKKAGSAWSDDDEFSVYVFPAGTFTDNKHAGGDWASDVTNKALKFKSTVTDGVYAYDPADGAAELIIKMGGTIKITGLPAKSYQIVEKEPSLVNGVQVYEWDNNVKPVTLDYVASGGTESVTFTNNKGDLTNIEIHKTVSGSYDGELFTFTVSPSIENLTDKITFKKTGGAAADVSDYDLTDAASSSFKMKAGVYAVISGLVPGSRYTVTEKDAIIYTTTNNNIEVVAGASSDGNKAFFVNTREVKKISITLKKDADYWLSGNSFTFQLYRLTGGTWSPVNDTVQTVTEAKTITWSDLTLDLGAKYRVYETTYGVFSPVFTANGAAITTGKDATGYYAEFEVTGTTANINFTVENKTTQLKITKAVSGSYGGETFGVTVYVEGTPAKLTGSGNTYYYDELGTAGAVTEFQITDKQTVTIYNLPKNKEITVVETQKYGYVSSITDGGKFSFGQDWLKEITVTNTNGAKLTVTKEFDGDYAGTEKSFDIQLWKKGPTVGTDTQLRVVNGVVVTGEPNTFTIEAGKSVVITGVEIGATYFVKEVGTNATKFDAKYNGKEKPEDGAVTVGGGDANVTITVTNKPKDAKLFVSKTLTAGDTGRFTITVEEVGGTFKWSGTFSHNGTDYKADGTDEIEVPGVEPGKTYKVTEAGADGTVLDYYTSEVALDGGTASLGKSADVYLEPGSSNTVAFTNTRKTNGEITVAKTVTGLWSDGDTFTFALTDSKGNKVNISEDSGTYDYVVDPDSTSNEFKISKGTANTNYVTIGGLTVGETYYVKEINTGDNYSFVSYGDNRDTQGTPAAVKTGETLTVTNVRKTGQLKVGKVVRGFAGDQSFTFKITGDIPTDAKIYIGTGSAQPLDPNGTFMLKDGETATISGLYLNAKYTITEDLNYTNFTYIGWAATSDADDAALTKDDVKITATVAGDSAYFFNKRNTGSIELTKKAEIWPDGVEFKFELYRKTDADSWTFVKSDNLKNNSKTTLFTDLYWGEIYRIYEVVNGNYINTTTGWTLATLPNGTTPAYYQEFNVTSNTAIKVDATNELTSLTVTKFVSGSGTGTFKFEVRDIDDNVQCFVKQNDGSYLYVSTGTESSFDITDKGSVVFHGLSVNTKYKVVETDNKGYNSKVDPDTVIFGANDLTKNVKITNTNEASLKITKEITNHSDPKPTTEFTVQLYKVGDLNPLYLDSSYKIVPSTISGANTQFTITHGQTITITGVEIGASYYVQETDADGYTTAYIGNNVKIESGNDSPEIKITNEAVTPKLTVTKNVTPANDDGVFRIEVKGRFSNDPTNPDATQSFIFDKDGGSPKYKFGDTATVENIIAGEPYTVTEFAENTGTVLTNYTTSAKNFTSYTEGATTGTVKLGVGDNKSVSFTNTRDTGSIKLDKTVVLPASAGGGGFKPDPNDKFVFTVYEDSKSDDTVVTLVEGTHITITAGDGISVENGNLLIMGSAFNDNGKLIGGAIEIKGLDKGRTYYVVEKDPAPKYKSSPEKSATAGGAGGTDKVEFINEVQNIGILKVTKTASGRDADTQLFYFQVTKGGNAVELSNDPTNSTVEGYITGGSIVDAAEGIFSLKSGDFAEIKNLYLGTEYKITELTTGYTGVDYFEFVSSQVGSEDVTTDNPVEVTPTNGTPISITFNNKRSTGSIKLTKTIGGTFLPNDNDMFVFTIVDESKTPVDLSGLTGISPFEFYKNGKDGKLVVAGSAFTDTTKSHTVTIKGLDVGHTYNIAEDIEGVQDSTLIYTQTVTNKGEVTVNRATAGNNVIFTNTVDTSGSITVEKSIAGIAADAWPDKTSFKFKLERKDGDKSWADVGTLTIPTDPGGAHSDTWSNLPIGQTYRVSESDATGYSNDGPWTFSLDGTSDATATVTAVNTGLGTLEVKKVGEGFDGDEKFKIKLMVGDETIKVYEKANNIYSIINGTSETVNISKNDSVTFVDLIPGITYKVVETGGKADDFDVSYNSYEDPADAAFTPSGSVPNGTVTITNELKGGLEVTKTIAKDSYFKDGETFEITVTDITATAATKTPTQTFIFGKNPGKTSEGEVIYAYNVDTVKVDGVIYNHTYEVKEKLTNAQEGYVTRTYKVNDEPATDPGVEYVEVKINGKVQTVTVTNERKLSEKALTVTKTVGGYVEDERFKFTVEIDGVPANLQNSDPNGMYYFDGDGILGSDTGAFTIKVGEAAVIKNLPRGAEYTVTEEARENFTLEWLKVNDVTVGNPSDTSASGKLDGTSPLKFEFHNLREEGFIGLEKVLGEGSFEDGEIFEITVTGPFEGKGGIWAKDTKSFYFTKGGTGDGLTAGSPKALGKILEIGGLARGEEYSVVEAKVWYNDGSMRDMLGYYDISYSTGSAGFAVVAAGSSDKLNTVTVTNRRNAAGIRISKQLIAKNSRDGFDLALTVPDGRYLTFDFTGGVYLFTGLSSEPHFVRIIPGAETDLSGVPLGLQITLTEQVNGQTDYHVAYLISDVKLDGGSFLLNDIEITKVTVVNTEVTQLVINKNVRSGNGAAPGSTFYFDVYAADGSIVPLTPMGGNTYRYDQSGTVSGIQLTTQEYPASEIVAAGSVIVYGLPYGQAFEVRERIPSDDYYLYSRAGTNFSFTAGETVLHTATFTNARNGGGGGDDGGGGGDDSYTTINDSITPLAQGAITIPEVPVPLAGGAPIIEIVGLIGVALVGTGIFFKRRNRKSGRTNR